MKFSSVIVSLALFGLVGCQTINFADHVTATPPTGKHKALLVAAAKEKLYDPYSVRDADLSSQLRFPSGVIAYCGRYNAKNALGAYTGREYVMVTFNNGILSGYFPAHAWCKTNQALLRWHRFAELENL
ncbi:hypothetical protein [Stappia sp.]|uniref:hypothetical protein n=1 Tax=Stappia sp. TaxID=1870903 RepID=UPI003C7A03D9